MKQILNVVFASESERLGAFATVREGMHCSTKTSNKNLEKLLDRLRFRWPSRWGGALR